MNLLSVSIKKQCIRVIVYIFTFSFISSMQAQDAKEDIGRYTAKDWQLTDLAKDSIYGASVTKAYDELLKGKTSRQVVVAVIDAGIDTAHEDLVGHIWTNTKEIPGNGIDDDKNGYVDDVHGWNFLGGKDGKNIEQEGLESYREYYRLNKLFGNVADSTATPENNKEFSEWQELKQQHTQDSVKATVIISRVTPLVNMFNETDSTWKNILHKDTITVADIKNDSAADSAATGGSTKLVLDFYAQRRIPETVPLEELAAEANEYVQQQQQLLASFATDPDAQRQDIVKDNPNDINDKNYGNNNIDAGTPTHGTHVAGIIAATRNNNIGMNGIADNVLIMPVRAVPDGDERDKDIALAIRYAVDNGAKIINMSFGKPWSPGKQWVDDAVKYAAAKDVLIIHAAGNDGKDIDTSNDFPSPEFLNNTGKAVNYITVGASAGGPDSLLAAPFSNYGSKEVDVFAPGVNVYSTIPGSKYASFSGTSMAAPVVTGIAALVLEYYPKLSATQLKYVIEHSVTPLPDDVVINPGSSDPVKFGTLSRTGGIVNAYNALKLAETIKGERKKKVL
ncbi:S8 family peptidase [Parafilimonas sp.]|uniref:S8 family peptidase n=1 Tax=Parafilimonas sp. TaxID=1969739 RepID=UPI0039E48E02